MKQLLTMLFLFAAVLVCLGAPQGENSEQDKISFEEQMVSFETVACITPVGGDLKSLCNFLVLEMQSLAINKATHELKSFGNIKPSFLGIKGNTSQVKKQKTYLKYCSGGLSGLHR